MDPSLFTTSNERVIRRPLPGYFLAIVSYVLMLAELPLLLAALQLYFFHSLFGFRALTLRQYDIYVRLLPFFIFPLVGVYFVLLRVFQTGKRFLMRTAEETIARDPRPYVLYLRAFNADVPASAVPEHGDLDEFSFWRFRAFTAMRLVSPRLLFAPPRTEEEQIVRAFNDIGPVIAVGTPGEAIPPFGASRVYIAAEEWQTRVSDLVRNAGTVVIRISEKFWVAPQSMLGMGSGSGLTQGLQWEVATVPREVSPGRLWFLIAASHEGYGRFWSLVHDAFPRGLPPSCDPEQRPGRVRGMIGFDGDWQPRLFPMSPSATSPFRLARYPVTTAIRERLRAMREGRLPRSPRLSLFAGVLATVLFAGFLVFANAVNWRFQQVRRTGTPVLATTTFTSSARPLPASPVLPTYVSASELMVMIPPSTVPVPLLKSRLPAPRPGLVQYAETLAVTVSIGANGAVLNVRISAINPVLGAFVEKTVRTWRFQPVLRGGTPVLAEASFMFTVRPLPANPVPSTRVSASELMVTIPPSAAPAPLLKAQVPIAPPGLVQSAEMVVVGVLIDTSGKVLNVSTSTKNPAVGAFVQNTVKTWRFQPVLGTRLPVRSVAAFTYPVRPLPANPARQPSSLPPSRP
jgi:hypothetical protein